MKNYLSLLLAMSLVVLTACEKTLFEAEPENNPEALFEDLWTTFDTDYAPFEERGVDWAEQYQVFRPQVTASTSDEELKGVFKSLLRTLNDGHVQLTTPGEDVFYSNLIIDQRIDNALFDLALIKHTYMQDNFKESAAGRNVYGWIGNIGYWHIQSIGDNMLLTDDILDYFSSADGLIVDLRHNRGGDFTYAFSEFGRLTDEEQLVFRSKTKNGKGPDDYTEWHDWRISPAGTYFNKPIVLITDRYTISAGERTAMAFKCLPNVTHIGDTTSGAFATKIAKELANGWAYTLVTQKVQFKDGVSYEGVGLFPDIYSKNSLPDMQGGQDKTLEMALGML